MKTAFFISDSYALTGPSIVNRYYRNYLSERYTFAAKEPTYLKRILSSVKNIFTHRVIIFSGVSVTDRLFLIIAKLLQRKIIYIMHGCVKEETRINRSHNPAGIKTENAYLKQADLVLGVSQRFSEWVCAYYPQIAFKVKTLTNGIDWDFVKNDITTQEKSKNVLSILGGGVPLKNVVSVCKAIEQLNQEGYNFLLKVFGREDLDSEKVKSFAFVHFFGKIPREDLFAQIAQTALFIQNSIFDSFALAPVEALTCGCSILCSKNVGSLSLFTNLREQDIIEDCFDTEEIKQKILYLLDNPNNERLVKNLDKEQTSFKHRAEELDAYIQTISKA